jgi:hypothetical protein
MTMKFRWVGERGWVQDRSSVLGDGWWGMVLSGWGVKVRYTSFTVLNYLAESCLQVDHDL